MNFPIIGTIAITLAFLALAVAWVEGWMEKERKK